MIDALYQDLVAFYGEKYFELRASGEVYEIEEPKKNQENKDTTLKKVKCSTNLHQLICVDSENFFGKVLPRYNELKRFQLNKVCDGFFITECKGQLYIFLLEMKSNFNKSIEAESQLYASFVRMLILLGILKHFPTDIKVKSIVLTCPATTEFKTKILKRKNQGQAFYQKFFDLLNGKEVVSCIPDSKRNGIPLKPEYLPTQLCVAVRQLEVDARGVALETINLDHWM